MTRDRRSSQRAPATATETSWALIGALVWALVVTLSIDAGAQPATTAQSAQPARPTPPTQPASPTSPASPALPAVASPLLGPYLGQTPPGATPQMFAPGFVSTDAHEFSCSFTPDGKEFYFARRDAQTQMSAIMVTRCVDGVWSVPAVAPFARGPMNFEPRVTPDGGRLYFSVVLPGEAGGPPAMAIRYVERQGGGWGEPQDPGAPFNPMKAMYVSLTKAGVAYVTDISGGMGQEAIAVARPAGGKYTELTRLGPPISVGAHDMYPYVAPDESYLVFSSQRPGLKASPGLFVARRQADGTWSEPRPLDLGTAAGTPMVSPDGKYLFFTGGERGRSDIYWVSAKVLE